MKFLFCQPGLTNKANVDSLIKNLIKRSLKLNNKDYLEINSLNKKNKDSIKLKKYYFISKKISLIVNGLIFFFKLKDLIKIRKVSHIFFDGYTIFDLFFFSILNFSKKTKLIIYLRIPYDQIYQTKYFFNISVKNLKKKENVVFITDTNNLKNHFKKNFKINSTILPIPGESQNKCKFNKIDVKNLNILFPGKSRDEKGIKNIIQMFKNSDLKDNVFFSFSENKTISNKLDNVKNLRLISLNSNLNYQSFILSIKKADIILLPYTHQSYRLRSSGIFIDTIKLNKLLFVPHLTWMSQILKKYELDKLVIKKWSIDIILSRLVYINKNFKSFHKKYQIMHAELSKNNSNIKYMANFKKII